MGIKRLGKSFGTDRLEAACQRALALQSASYKGVKTILANGRDREPLPEQPPDTPPIIHANVRGAEYYNANHG